MARSARVAATAALLVALLVMAAPAEGAVTGCGQVMVYLAPCVNYAEGKPGGLPATCCNGVRNLNSAAATPADRKVACNCLKQQTTSMTSIRPDLVAGIPSKCGVNIPYAISASTDCSKVH